MMAVPQWSQADAPSVAVLYPELREPFRGVFLEIVEGIEAGLRSPVKSYALTNDDSALKSQLAQERVEVAITLGRSGLLAARKLADTLPVVVGATFVSPDAENRGLAGITLAPAPDALFDRLRRLAPEIKRVSVVYDPKSKTWEIEQARKAARERGLTLNALPAEDLRSSAALYRTVLDETRGGGGALWLLQDDAAMDERALLPLILTEAWDNNLVVFSSNPDHVRKGALFSLYPDNAGMGRSLAAMARKRLQGGVSGDTDIEPLKDLLFAVNLRTAEHLGLRFDSQDRRQFDLVFPAP
ncbi:ABC transporter substrate binding protein [Methylogaea oryzae]|nr:ABC transporter substrate binding protein [Methylogaea oryzae]